MNKEISRIVRSINANYNGTPWFGESILDKLEEVDAKMANEIPEKLSHSIVEIMAHMMAWRQFTIEKLNGNIDFEVWETELDWVKFNDFDEDKWTEFKESFENNQELLIDTINKTSPSKLDDEVEGRPYNYRLLLNGLVQHDIYHIGQISIVRKLI
jgi:uncharacterized damage-inducible protein DinB